MIRYTNSIKTEGPHGIPIKIECSVSNGIGIHVVGICDAAVKEGLLRTVTALQAEDYTIPGQKIIINFSPNDLQEKSCRYDLATALSIIAATGQVQLENLEKFIVLGELGLDASVRMTDACIQAIETAKSNGIESVIIPRGNAQEIAPLLNTAFSGETHIYAVSTLKEAVDVVEKNGIDELRAETVYEMTQNDGNDLKEEWTKPWDKLAGNEGLKRAITIAAAGGHGMLLVGPPGTDKNTAAKALCSLLPPMTQKETVEVAEIYSAAGQTQRFGEQSKKRPCREAHPINGLRALLGGGSGNNILPGEVSLAHNGVLFIDNVVEVPKAMLESLRGPMEDKKVTIARLKTRVSYKADFVPVFASHPCPCGWHGSGDRCNCTPNQRRAYLSHLGGPVMDRVVVQAYINPVVLGNAIPGTPFQEAVDDVRKAREMQAKRYNNLPRVTNDNVPSDEFIKKMKLQPEACELSERLIEHMQLNVKNYMMILRIARTIADIYQSEEILPPHVAEASSYRFLDRLV